MPFPQLDSSKFQVLPLSERRSFIEIDQQTVDPSGSPPDAGALRSRIETLAERISAARRRGSSVMLTYGAHLVKNGAGLVVNSLVRDRWLTHLATHGGGIIHDWEFAFLGRSSESVRMNAPVGRFGTWDETGKWINLAALVGAADGLGLGESVGKFIAEEGLDLPAPNELAKRIKTDPRDPLTAARADLLEVMGRFDLVGGRFRVEHPYKKYSITAVAYEQGVPFTVHPGIGYDIITNHPMFHGGAIGRGAAVDARIFAASVDRLDGGAYLSMGSAIMSPQVFEKAFSAVNNIRQVEGRPPLRDHYLAIVDLQDSGGWNWAKGEPPPDHPAYYLRFCKTFYRMGGTLEYLHGDHVTVVWNLLAELRRRHDELGTL